MMKKISVITLVAALTACGESELSSLNFDALNSSSVDVMAFGEAKRIPERSKDRRTEAYDQFKQRTDITNYLLAERFSSDVKARIDAQELVNNAILAQYFQSLAEEKITPAQIEQYYNDHAGQFGSRQYEVAHLLVRIMPNADETAISAAEKIASEALARLKSGDDFSELVAEISDDSSTKSEGGLLPLLSSNNLQAAIESELSGLAPGEFTQPVRTERGLQIFKLIDVETETTSLEDATPKIRYVLKQELENKEMARLLTLSGKASS